MPIAAARAFDFESITEPDAMAAAAPMACHLTRAHSETPRHRTDAEIGEAPATAARRRGTGGRKLQNARRIRVRTLVIVCHFLPLMIPLAGHVVGGYRQAHQAKYRI